MYFRSLAYLPLAEATVLVFSAPIFIALLSGPLLREAVGLTGWAAVLLGFAGVLIIVQPGGAAFHPAALLALGTAFFYALFMLAARGIPRSEGILCMMFYVNFFPLLFSVPVAAAVWVPVALDDLWLLAAMAAAGSLGLTLIAQAFRMAPAAVVAPFDYTALIWAAGFGFLIWGDLPGLWTLVGAAVIVASSALILLREGRARRGPGTP
jgi:drug/metabolite transporter (DMT)-like permease